MLVFRLWSVLIFLVCSITWSGVCAFAFVFAAQHPSPATRGYSANSAPSTCRSSGEVCSRGLEVSNRGARWGKLSLSMSDEDEMEDTFGAKAMQERTRAELQTLISEHKIIAFIKGNRLMPQCGFSGTLVNILQSLSVPFETVDVLADDRIRQGIKDFSDWPTIPQLYLDGEFVGGSDIVIELFQSGELQEMIEVAAAS